MAWRIRERVYKEESDLRGESSNLNESENFSKCMKINEIIPNSLKINPIINYSVGVHRKNPLRQKKLIIVEKI